MRIKMLISGGRLAAGNGVTYEDVRRGDVLDFTEPLAWPLIWNGYAQEDCKAPPGRQMDISRARDAFRLKYGDRAPISATT